MNERVVVFLGLAIVTTILLLIGTDRELKPIMETLIQFTGVVGALLAIYDFFRKK